MNQTGRIQSIVPDGSYQGQHGKIWTHQMAILTADNQQYVGQIGSKTEVYPLAPGNEISVTITDGQHGRRFKKYDPQRVQQDQQQAQQGTQQPAQGQNRGQASEDIKNERIMRGNALNAVMSAMTISNVEMEGYLRAGYEWCKNGVWVLGTRQSQGGQPNPQYVGDNPPPPVEDDIPF